MGYKTVPFTSEHEQRTYVQGEFTGKYFGTINHQTSVNNFEIYDIKVYDGEVSNLKNEKEHTEIINETVYNAIVSETQIVQKSFENVLVNLDQTIEGYDSIRLAIKEPKLENVKIYDVVKNSNQTFGTLTCIVSGYLLETNTETNTIQVETCDNCNQYLEECLCQESALVNTDEPLNEPPIPEVKKTFFEKFSSRWTDEYINWNWFAFKPFSFGCIGFFGLLIAILLLISFGFPGILIGAIFLLLFFIGSLTRIFPKLSLRWRQLLYTSLGFLLIGLLFNLLEPVYKNYNYGVNSRTDSSSPQNEGNQKILDSQNSPIVVSTEEEIIEKSAEATSNTTSMVDTITILPKESYTPQNGMATISENRNNTLLPESSNNILVDSSVSQNNQINRHQQSRPENATETLNGSDEENIVTQSEKLINSKKSATEVLNEASNNSKNKDGQEQQNPITQSTNESQNSIINRPEKLKKTVEIMAGIEFQEGEVFICKGESSKRYHFDPACYGLSNCSTRIYQVNIPAAERLGRTLCELEE